MMLLMSILMKTEDQLFRFSQETNAEMTTLILGVVQKWQIQLPIFKFFKKCILAMPSHSRTPGTTNCAQFVYLLLRSCLGIGFTSYRKEKITQE